VTSQANYGKHHIVYQRFGSSNDPSNETYKHFPTNENEGHASAFLSIGNGLPLSSSNGASSRTDLSRVQLNKKFMESYRGHL
jgi:hypothetical protein